MSCAKAAAGDGHVPRTGPRTGMAQVLLREIAARLATLTASGLDDAIDLRSLPMSEADRDELEARLGQGEVSAVVTVAGLDAAGTSEVWETAISGVWWVRHRGADGHVASEEIVVTRIPEILVTHPDDTRDGLARLKAQIEAEAPALHDQSWPQRDCLAQQQEGR